VRDESKTVLGAIQ